jgi:diaminopimelate decarboxylase
MSEFSFLTSHQGYSHFVYNEKELNLQVEHFKKLKTQGLIVDFFYSVKSNPNAHVLKFLSPRVDGFDISTLKELELIRKIGFDLKKCTFSGPAKTVQALRRAFELGLRCIHLDSLDEWYEVKKLELEYGQRLGQSLRLKHTSPLARKLGFSVQELEQIKKHDPKQKFQGLHFYLGRESFNSETLTELIAEIENFLTRESSLFDDKPHLFLGLGLPMWNLASIENTILKHESFFKKYEVSFECGRALVQSCGQYWAQVLSVKKRKPRNLVIINGGLQHLATKLPSPNYGMSGITISHLRLMGEGAQNFENYDLSGSLGIWHDQLATEISLPANIQRGDWIQIKGVGAYGWTSATNQFIGPTPIREWWQGDGANLQMISPENMNSYLEVQLEK